MRKTLLCLGALLLCGCSGLFYRAINIGVDEDRIRSASYDPRHGLALDIHPPVAPGTRDGAPVVVFLHGGSWRDGDRQGYRFVGERLAAHGALVLVPDYRKAPGHAFPAFMHDAARAVAWARDNAGRLGGDPDRIFLMGHSAGAHIVALLATDRRYLENVSVAPESLAGVIGLAGPYDFLPLTDPELREVFGDEAQWPRSQPVNFTDGDEPPFLLLHGDQDSTVLPRNSARLASRLDGAGGESRYVTVEGAGHVGLLLELRDEPPGQVMTETLRFIGLAD